MKWNEMIQLTWHYTQKPYNGRVFYSHGKPMNGSLATGNRFNYDCIKWHTNKHVLFNAMILKDYLRILNSFDNTSERSDYPNDTCYITEKWHNDEQLLVTQIYRHRHITPRMPFLIHSECHSEMVNIVFITTIAN